MTRLGTVPAAAFAAAILAAAPAAAQQPLAGPAHAATIRVTATGEARATPDQAWIDFGMETSAPTARAAGDQNARSMERVVAALLAAGVARADIQTHDYNLSPEYTPPPQGNGEPVLRGYRAINMVAVRTDRSDRVGPLIDAALAAGANRANSIRFGLKNPDAVRARALQQALERGRAEAQAIAAGLGVRLGRVLDASTAAEPPRAFEGGRMSAMMDKSAQTPVEAGEQAVSASVSLVFAIEQ